MKPRIHGLMYHDVVRDGPDESGLAGAGPAHYKLPWGTFLEHLDRMRALAVTAPVADPAGAPPPGGAWSLTFDDGGASAFVVAEELARRTWPAYFFVTSGLVGTPGFVDAEAIRAIDRLGHVVGSHSVTHPERMSALTAAELDREWGESAAMLADILGKRVRTASVPGGYYARPVARAAARAGISVLFNSEPVRTARTVDGCLVVGRYAIRADTGGELAARAAAGESAPWLRQYVAWSLRKPAKRLAGERYTTFRRAVLARSRRARA